jgi:hypothetical protein
MHFCYRQQNSKNWTPKQQTVQQSLSYETSQQQYSEPFKKYNPDGIECNATAQQSRAFLKHHA